MNPMLSIEEKQQGVTSQLDQSIPSITKNQKDFASAW